MGSLLTCFGLCGDGNEEQAEAKNSKTTAKPNADEAPPETENGEQIVVENVEDTGASKATNANKRSHKRNTSKNKQASTVSKKKPDKKPKEIDRVSKQTVNYISDINTSVNGPSSSTMNAIGEPKLVNPKMKQAQKQMPALKKGKSDNKVDKSKQPPKGEKKKNCKSKVNKPRSKK